VLARYRFVADLFDARNNVAKYGDGDRLSTAMVSRKVRKLTLYNPDPISPANVHAELAEVVSVAARPHDILAGPLAKRHDAICALDAFRGVSRDDEDACVRHLRDSLVGDHGILIIGTPSRDAAAGRRDAGTFPHDAIALKALAERHFHVVFPFCMVDETLRPGIVEAADYALAVCCCRKTGS
jgi:hypothetical protein